MWDVLSGDFDVNLSKETVFENVILSAKRGSIVVFHDSLKAFDRLEYALPRILEHFTEKGYRFESLNGVVQKLERKKFMAAAAL